MARLPVVNHRQIERVLRRIGFAAMRQKGGHVFYAILTGARRRCPDTKAATSRRRCCTPFSMTLA